MEWYLTNLQEIDGLECSRRVGIEEGKIFVWMGCFAPIEYSAEYFDLIPVKEKRTYVEETPVRYYITLETALEYLPYVSPNDPFFLSLKAELDRFLTTLQEDEWQSY